MKPLIECACHLVTVAISAAVAPPYGRSNSITALFFDPSRASGFRALAAGFAPVLALGAAFFWLALVVALAVPGATAAPCGVTAAVPAAVVASAFVIVICPFVDSDWSTPFVERVATKGKWKIAYTRTFEQGKGYFAALPSVCTLRPIERCRSERMLNGPATQKIPIPAVSQRKMEHQACAATAALSLCGCAQQGSGVRPLSPLSGTYRKS